MAAEFECFNNLIDVLRWRADIAADKRVFTFLVDGDRQEDHLTFRDLDRWARAVAVTLRSKGAAGDRAVLICPPGLPYIAAFFGCLYAGVVAVPAYPPDPFRLKRTLPRLQAVIADAQADIVLTTKAMMPMAELVFSFAPELRDKHWVAVDAVPQELSETWEPPSVDSHTLAFLQYTSGSTGNPKGVMLTHGNLLANELMIHEALGHDPSRCLVGWVPLYHDMGLMLNVLQPICG